MFRLPALFGLVMLGLALLVSAGATQDAKKDKDKDAKKDPPKIKTALPKGFDSLGLSEKQVARIFAIQTEHRTKVADLQQKVAELQKKIGELKKAENGEVFKSLTDEQQEKYLKSKGIGVKEPEKDKKDEKKSDKKEPEKDKKIGLIFQAPKGWQAVAGDSITFARF